MSCYLCDQQEISCEDRYIAQETINTEHGTSVSVSIRGEPRNMTIYEIGKIEVPQFATLWTVSPLSLAISGNMHVRPGASCIAVKLVPI